jgi:hypothetical protein
MDSIFEIAHLRNRVSQREGQLTFLFTHLNITYVPDADVLNKPFVELLKSGRKMNAIKAYMDIHGASFSVANAAIDALSKKL